MAHSKMGPLPSTSFLSWASETSPWVLRAYQMFMTPPRLKAFGCLMRRLGSVSGQGERQCGSGMNIGRIVRPERVEVKGNGILL